MEIGYHHIDMASFCGDYYVAVDGMRKDKFINNITLALMKSLELIGG
jgi:hypothetical protein